MQTQHTKNLKQHPCKCNNGALVGRDTDGKSPSANKGTQLPPSAPPNKQNKLRGLEFEAEEVMEKRGLEFETEGE